MQWFSLEYSDEYDYDYLNFTFTWLRNVKATVQNINESIHVEIRKFSLRDRVDSRNHNHKSSRNK